MDKQNILEVLKLFRDYCGWMYYSDKAKGLFNSSAVRDWNGVKMKLEIRNDGKYSVFLPDHNNIELIVDTRIKTRELTNNNIDNLDYQSLILNEQIIPENIKDIVKSNIHLLVGSAFTRSAGLTLFARFQDESLEGFANDLSLAK